MEIYTYNMDALEWVNTLVVALGLPTVLGAFLYIGRKLQALETLKKEVDDNIRPDLKDVRERLATWEGKSAGLYQAQSPISLTEQGRAYLRDSGLKDFIDENTDGLMQQVEHEQTVQTPYDVQQVAFEFFDELDLPDSLEKRAKNFAFNHGVSMDALRRIGGIYFRDLCLAEHNFNAKDLDTEES